MILSSIPLPDYGVIQVIGLMNERIYSLLEEQVKAKLGFKLTWTESLDPPIILARRLNLANLGKSASLVLYGARSSFDIIRFVDSLADISDTQAGDKVIDNRAMYSCSIGMPDCASVQYSEQVPTPTPNKDALSSGRPKTSASKSDSFLSKLFGRKKKYESRERDEACEDSSLRFDESAPCAYDDWDDSSCSYSVERQEVEVDEESNDLENERTRELDEIKMLILRYVAKHHADPTDELMKLMTGKVVINPSGLSRLVVNGDTRIVLADYDETEIKLSARERTLYVFFLLHPEGVRQVDVCDYSKQLQEIYGIVKPGASAENASRVVSNLCDPFGDALRQSISKIKGAVKHVIRDEVMASDYYVKGNKGGLYGISLKAELVTLPAIFKTMRNC